jgi:hypothetical protein
MQSPSRIKFVTNRCINNLIQLRIVKLPGARRGKLTLSFAKANKHFHEEAWLSKLYHLKEQTVGKLPFLLENYLLQCA